MNLFRQHFVNIIENAKIKTAIIRRYGFHEDGLRINTAIKMYKLIVRPVLEYCAQTLSNGRYCRQSNLAEPCGFAKELEQLQTEILKKLINCPRSTSPSIVRLFCGVEPLACRLELLKLRYFWKIFKGSEDTIPHKVIKYRKANFLEFNNGFAQEVFNI